MCLTQGVHESKGVTGDYLRLEALIQKVVSPYLGTHGLYSRDGSSSLHCSSCVLGMSEVMFDGCAFRRALHFGVFDGFQHKVIKYFQKSVCSAPGPPSQAAPQSPRTQWYAPRVTTFPCWPPWWSLTATLPPRGTRASDVTPSLRWRPAWRRASPWPSPRPLPPTTPAHLASPITLQPPRTLLHFQVRLHCRDKNIYEISRGYPVKIDQCCTGVCKQSDI